MSMLSSVAPVAAAAFAVPQFVPQIRRLGATGDAAGVSLSWAALTCVNNAAWIAYFAFARYWTALIPSVSVAVLAGLLAIMLSRRGSARSRPLILIAAWSALLVSAAVAAGGAGLGTLLTGGFIVQVTPPLWTAYRAARPSGVSAGTWLLIFAELACWLIFGVQQSDPRLITLGAAGVIASTLMLARIQYTTSIRQPARHRGLTRDCPSRDDRSTMKCADRPHAVSAARSGRSSSRSASGGTMVRAQVLRSRGQQGSPEQSAGIVRDRTWTVVRSWPGKSRGSERYGLDESALARP